jgi:hypothetical protein
MKKLLGRTPVSVIVFVTLAVLMLILGLYTQVTNNGIKEENYPEITVVENGITGEENDGADIFAVGTPKVTENPVDELTGVTAEGIMLYREVSMYQYTTDGDEVYTEFRAKQMADVHGAGSEYKNPVFPQDLESACFFGKASVSGGNLMLSESCLLTIAESFGEYVLLDTGSAASPISSYIPCENGFFSGKDPENPEIGDIKITYYYIPAEENAEYTFIGAQDNITFCKAGEESSSTVLNEAITTDEYFYRYAGEPGLTAKIFYVLSAVSLIVALILIIKNSAGGKKRKKKHFAFAAVLLGLIISANCLLLTASADFGDYGGGYDYGDYGGGYDSGGYDYGGNDYDYDYDNDYSRTTTRETVYYYFMYPVDDPYDGSSSYFTSAGEVAGLETLNTAVSEGNTNSGEKAGIFGIFGIFEAVILGIRKKFRPATRAKQSKHISGAAATDANTLKPLSRYFSEDPGFDEDAFKAKLSSVYAELQGGWQNKDIAPLRKYMTDAFYAQMDRQLNNYRRNHQTNIVSDIKVTKVDLKGWYTAGGNDVMVAELFTSIRDYVIDDATGDVVKGSKDSIKLMRYEWSLVRPCGTKTGEETTHTEVCPNCGAPVDINKAGKCEYCGSIIETKASDWAISSIKGLAQKTVGG